VPASPYAPHPDKVLCLVASCRGPDMARQASQSFIEVPEASTKVLSLLPPQAFAFRFMEFDMLTFRVFGAAVDPLKAIRRSDLYYYRVSSIAPKKIFDGKDNSLKELLRREADPGFVAKIDEAMLLPLGEHDHIYNDTNFHCNPHFHLRPTLAKPEVCLA